MSSSKIEVKFNDFQTYKHDTVGKFNFINQLISTLGEDSLSNKKNNEVFHAIHLSLVKMVRTSRETLARNLNQDFTLVIESEPALSLEQLPFQGLILRYESKPGLMSYHYSINENQSDHIFNLGVLLTSLPIKNVTIDKTVDQVNYNKINSILSTRSLS